MELQPRRGADERRHDEPGRRFTVSLPAEASSPSNPSGLLVFEMLI
jgi:hypothetical protein